MSPFNQPYKYKNGSLSFSGQCFAHEYANTRKCSKALLQNAIFNATCLATLIYEILIYDVFLVESKTWT